MVDGMMSRFTQISEWIYFLFIVQLCWLLGVAIGLGVLGISPATYAVFEVIRKRLQGEENNVGKRFWQHYRKYLKKQWFSFLWIITGLFLYYDVRLLFSYDHLLTVILGALFVSLLILYLLCSMVIIPIFTHFEMKWPDRIRLALTVVVTQPHISLGLCLSTLGLYLILIYIPIIYFLIGISVTALLYTKLSLFAFKRIEEKGFVRMSLT
ncbi:DUF624 domain-containing protein [Anaerobacillus sp. CMMVII]|uniref:YesL family protein n=1 Tax=Anaerobacillus sp. CMMVII TaxID=2755588 RepID=UPI0021B70793|nr:DUF624 domain-containing protein [Anaerobacillus sp. CMMVII]MCT8139259.1 DUF624 domain-containing protein [Anaerobacillus sp. CMMVII]